MNKKILVIVAILAGVGLFAGGFFFSQANAQANQQGWMMGNWNDQVNANMMGNAQIIDETSGAGAFEVLVDPATGNIFPEPGPNMMWNTEYGMMNTGNYGMMGGMMNGQYGSGMMGQYDSDMMGEDQYGGMMGGNMMGNFGYAPDAEINITAENAVALAQEYLDAYLPGKTADDHADVFPGYYTLHVLEDGETIGMLSVNAFSGQVFLHHWHGTFIEMTDEEHA